MLLCDTYVCYFGIPTYVTFEYLRMLHMLILCVVLHDVAPNQVMRFATSPAPTRQALSQQQIDKETGELRPKQSSKAKPVGKGGGGGGRAPKVAKATPKPNPPRDNNQKVSSLTRHHTHSLI